ncbi:hypothetical protein RF11_00763 [Thelohanellus kitauei]|uniref:Uncharacterized protein n=1 Tax=Thelohanellus kitauei TaxID=669202 RepID=A0A0C2LZT1_THEKT|nr:hypothetical protein RF11_00763 [Thelohanellus kitauei]
MLDDWLSPMKKSIDYLFGNTGLSQSGYIQDEKVIEDSKPEKKFIRPHKIIYHQGSKVQRRSDKKENDSLTDTVASSVHKRMLNMFSDALKQICKRQFIPFCRPQTGMTPCVGPNCIIAPIRLSCQPGDMNCMPAPMPSFPSPDISQASGVLYIPKRCDPSATNCNPTPVSQPQPPPEPPVILKLPITPPGPTARLIIKPVTAPPPSVEINFEKPSSLEGYQCCTPHCSDESNCVLLHGKKYRLVPDEPTICGGSECSDFVQPSPQYSFRTIPVPEDCITTLKDLDFSPETLRHASPCQKSAIKVVVNLGRSLDDLSRAVRQVYDVGGCSLTPPDAKLVGRSCRQLLLNGCCSPTGGNMIRIGGGC